MFFEITKGKIFIIIFAASKEVAGGAKGTVADAATSLSRHPRNNFRGILESGVVAAAKVQEIK